MNANNLLVKHQFDPCPSDEQHEAISDKQPILLSVIMNTVLVAVEP